MILHNATRNGQNCGNCFNRGEANVENSSYVVLNVCLLNPPQVVYRGLPPDYGAKADSFVPVVSPTGWCAQWRRELEEKNDEA